MVLYESLSAHCPDFHLYVFAFDDSAHSFLKSLSTENLTVISLKEFEDNELLAVKSQRTAAEYCWTCTPSTILYCIETFGITHCTYLDADMRFYSDPIVLIEEMGDQSVMITDHRYTSAYDQTALSGKYCVQFMVFKSDERGLKVLNWWRNACLDWCYARAEDGKFGDQKYLDDWTSRFEGVHELQHLGGGLAPWNVQQYQFNKQNGKLTGTEIATGKTFEVVFFHFHGLKFYTNGVVLFTSLSYELTQKCKALFYFPYIKLLNEQAAKIRRAGYNINANGASEHAPAEPLGFTLRLKYYLTDIRRSFKNISGAGDRHRLLHYHYHSVKSPN